MFPISEHDCCSYVKDAEYSTALDRVEIKVGMTFVSFKDRHQQCRCKVSKAKFHPITVDSRS